MDQTTFKSMLKGGFSKAPRGHSKWIGIEMSGIGDDWAETRIPNVSQEWMAGINGVYIAGPLITLIDSASATAVLAKLGEMRSVTTVDMRLDILRCAGDGLPLVARGECLSLSGNLALVRTTAHDGNPEDPIALAMCSFYI